MNDINCLQQPALMIFDEFWKGSPYRDVKVSGALRFAFIEKILLGE